MTGKKEMAGNYWSSTIICMVVNHDIYGRPRIKNKLDQACN